MKGLKIEKGITLIALVVTIIVLIILATVSIGMVTGENGLIKMAEKARDAYENSAQREDADINELLKEIAEENLPNDSPEVPITMKVKLKVDEAQVTGTTIPVSVAEVTTEKNEEKTIDENLTYEWYINDEESKDVGVNSSCTFSDLNEAETYTIKCLVTDNVTGGKGTGEVTILSFKVVDSLYRGTQGMTWNEWINSGYKKTFPLNEETYLKLLNNCGYSRY